MPVKTAASSPRDHALLKTNLKQLRLPTMLAEFEKLAREAAETNQDYLEFLLRLTELELTSRSANALENRIKQAHFPMKKDFDSFDFSVSLGANKQKLLELARGHWIDERSNCCLIGASGTGKTHVAISLGLAACRLGKRVRFFTAAHLVSQLEACQQQHQLERFLKQLDRIDLLICDELGYLSFSRVGAELLFQVFADRYERASVLVTSNLPFSEWQQIFQGDRMTSALLDRLTHHCEIFEMNGESYRFRESMKEKKKERNPPAA
ncbi:MAG: IS21-like element helper ATPase IstB [Pirellulaceae bacterium]|nr:IS21-like element helper ATPase IstB [Planctomycetales bacterium]